MRRRPSRYVHSQTCASIAKFDIHMPSNLSQNYVCNDCGEIQGRDGDKYDLRMWYWYVGVCRSRMLGIADDEMHCCMHTSGMMMYEL